MSFVILLLLRVRTTQKQSLAVFYQPHVFRDILHLVDTSLLVLSHSPRLSVRSSCLTLVNFAQLAVPNVPGVVDVLRFHWEAELVKLNSDMEVRTLE